MDILILKIAKLCSDYYFVEYNRLLFEFEKFLVIINFRLSNEAKGDLDEFLDYFDSGDFRERRLSDLPEKFKNELLIDNIFISDYEYLGSRRDYTPTGIPKKSIALRLFSFVRVINSVAPNLILSYKVDENDGYQNPSAFCPSEPNYIFQIYIDHTSPKVLALMRHLSHNAIREVFPNSFYQPFIKSYKKLELKKEVSIVNSNTKARRLGYLVLLAIFFQSFQKIPSNKINKRFEEYSIDAGQGILSYLNTKGIIKLTKTGISAQPYITLAGELEWISKVHRVNIPGKLMKVYQVLKSQLDEKESNPFYLSELDRLFFLEVLLKNDFFYLSSILELLFVSSDGCSYQHLRDSFQVHLINRLNDNIREVQFEGKSSKVIRNLQRVKNRIEKWEKPEKYLEHVLMPRLNWLFDLNIVEFSQVNKVQLFKLTSSGKKLFQNICFWIDVNFGFVINPDEFLKRFYIHTFDSVYSDVNRIDNSSKEEVGNKINEYIGESFSYFKTLAPNRVTASQAIIFTKYKLYCKDHLSVGQRFIENHLMENTQAIFVYKFQEQYNDGYIQKINQ
ncbi:MAG: hypothetical protein KDC34_13915 [Saprospiraceae bacterium]|nr:hypothetical protein [Saprospiraceae bacterium]